LKAAILILLSALAIAIPLSSMTNEIVIEAEDLTDFHDIGGTLIHLVTCSGASGGHAVEGFDTPGEWIEIVFQVDSAGIYADSLRSAGNLGWESDLRVTIFNSGPQGEDLYSTFHTYGQGIG